MNARTWAPRLGSSSSSQRDIQIGKYTYSIRSPQVKAIQNQTKFITQIVVDTAGNITELVTSTRLPIDARGLHHLRRLIVPNTPSLHVEGLQDLETLHADHVTKLSIEGCVSLSELIIPRVDALLDCSPTSQLSRLHAQKVQTIIGLEWNPDLRYVYLDHILDMPDISHLPWPRFFCASHTTIPLERLIAPRAEGETVPSIALWLKKFHSFRELDGISHDGQPVTLTPERFLYDHGKIVLRTKNT